MLKWLLRRRLDAFEREYGYDAGYLHAVLDVDPWALVKFGKVAGLARYRKDVPKDAWVAAGLVGVLAGDCGPCTQLAVTMAEREGVAPEVLRAVLERDTQAMPEHVALVFRFAQAALAHDADADALRQQIVERWGPRALVSLGFALTSARLFPTLKYALGYGQACTRVTVGGKPVAVAHEKVV